MGKGRERGGKVKKREGKGEENEGKRRGKGEEKERKRKGK